MRISDWSSDVCSSDLSQDRHVHRVPIDRRFLAVNQTMLIKVKKQRLFVAVIFRFAGGEFAGPVEREAKLLQLRSEEHTSELQSLMRISYAVFCLKKTTHIL